MYACGYSMVTNQKGEGGKYIFNPLYTSPTPESHSYGDYLSYIKYFVTEFN